MRKLILLITILPSLLLAEQQQDIESLLRDIRYLKETTLQMKKSYQNDKSKIRFNYDAFLEQLKVQEQGIMEYLNKDIKEIRKAPRPVINSSMVR